MQLDSPILRAFLAGMAVVLSGGHIAARSQSGGVAGTSVLNPAEDPLSPQLLIPLRATSPSELADTWPLGHFVPRRLTTAPTYDPAFRLPARGERSRQVHLAARSQPVAPKAPRANTSRPKSANTPSKPAKQLASPVYAVMPFSPFVRTTIKVMSPEDK